MKRKMIAMMLAIVLVATTFAGCGSKEQDTKTAETVEEAVEETEVVAEEIAEEPAEEVEEIEEVAAIIDVTVEETEYEAMGRLNANLMYAKKGDKYGVIDLEGNEILPFEYDYCEVDFQNNCFAVGMVTGDNTVYYLLMDATGEIIWENIEFPEYYIASYNEDIMQLIEFMPAEGDVANCIYIDVENGFEVLFNINEDTVPGYRGASPVNNGVLSLGPTSMDADGDIQNLLDMTGTYDFCRSYWISFPYAVTDTGLINGLNLTTEGAPDGFYVYDMNNGEFYPLPEEVFSTDTFFKDGMYYTCTDDGFILLRKEETGPMALYDALTQTYYSDYVYSYVGLEAHNTESKILISNEDGSQWSYLDDDSCEECGTWYTDASDFNNGYALVQMDDGLFYVVDEDLKVVSEGFEGDSCYSLDIPYYFVIKKGDFCYLVKI